MVVVTVTDLDPLRHWPLRHWPLRHWPLRHWPLRHWIVTAYTARKLAGGDVEWTKN